MESVSFSCSFEAGRNAGASPASREAVLAEVPFLEAMEKALPAEPPGSLPAEREAGGAKRLPGSRPPIIFLNEPLSFGISERTPQAVPSQAAQEALSSDGDLFGSGKTAILLETLQALRCHEKLGLPESLEEEPRREPGSNEADPESAFPSSFSGKEGSESFSPCSPPCGPRILPLAASEQKAVSEEPKADPSIAENSLAAPLDPNAAEGFAQGSSPFPVKERASRGQNGRFGDQEENAELGESERDDRALPAFLQTGPLQLPIEALSTHEGPVKLADSSMPPSVSLAGVNTGVEAHHGRNSQVGSQSDGLTEALRNELPLNVDLRREAFLPAGRFLEQIPLQGTGGENALQREGASRRLDVLIPGQTVLRPKEEHGGERLTLPKWAGILSEPSEGGKRDVQGKKSAAHRLTEGMLPSGELPLGQTVQAGPGTPEISKASALETGIAQMTAYLSSSRGRQRGVIRLHPPELGDVRVVLFSAGERVRLSLTVESPDVREMVVKSEESLREGLRQQGIHLGEMTVDVNGEPKQGFGAPNPERERVLSALAEDGFSEAGQEEAEARIDLVNGLFSWVA